MFNVTRTYPAPTSVAKKKYNEKDIILALKPIFLEKCYLCERDEIQDAEVEHFEPQAKNAALKYVWDNLYYSCSRCNSIKSNTHIDLLDCTDPLVNVGDLISCIMPSAPSDDVTVKATHATPCAKTVNTIDLLEKCYNMQNTGLRGVSRESLMEQMWGHYCDLLSARQVLSIKKSGISEIKHASETIEAMLRIDHPFSIFWRNYFLKDALLMRKYSHLKVGF